MFPLFIFCVFLVLPGSFASSCETPLGKTSQCISLYKCPELLAPFRNGVLSSPVINFLRKSQCGFEGSTPQVCCGPLIIHSNLVSGGTTQTPTAPSINKDIEPVNPSDSAPAPFGACGEDDNGNRIFGGIITHLDEFPWMALLGYKSANNTISYQCGGALINERYVLTAAHCVVGEVEKYGNLETVRLGEFDTKSDIDCFDEVCADPPQEISVHKYIPHPGYADSNNNRKDDIALVRLARRVKYSYYVQPLCLASGDQRLENEKDLFIAGWGKTLDGTKSSVKLKLKLPLYNKEKCTTKFKTAGISLTDDQVCAGGIFAEDACRGDSGGPLMRRRNDKSWEAVGVISSGLGCGADDWPGVYTSVPNYRKWIEDTMKDSNV